MAFSCQGFHKLCYLLSAKIFCVRDEHIVDETVKAPYTSDSLPEKLLFLEKITANLPGMIVQFLQGQDGSQSAVYVSSGCWDLCEVEPEVVQRDCQVLCKLIHPQDIKSCEESVAISSSQCVPWRWEGRIITPSGKLKWVQGASCPERQGENVIWAGLFTDITERKLTELEQLESEEMFCKAFRCSPIPITVVTLHEGRYVDVNNAFLQISEFSREEVIGHTVTELNIWRNIPLGMKMQQMLLEQGFIYNLESEFYTKSGKQRVVLFSAEMIHVGGESCVLCVINDMTQRKQAEELLQLSAQRDRLLAETLKRIRHSLNLDDILRTTVNEVRQFLQADRVFIALRDAKAQSRILAESVDPQYPSVLNWKPEHESYLLELKRLLTTNQIRVVEDYTQIAASPELTALYQEFRTRATLGVPIILGEEFFGALIANQCSEARHWQPMEIDLLQQMSEQVAIAIQQAKLYQELAQLTINLERQVEERTAQLQQKMQELQEVNRVKDVVLHTVSHDLRTSVMGNLMVLNNLLSQGQGGRGKQGGEEVVGVSVAPSSIPVSRTVIERMIQGNTRQLAMIDSLLEIHASVEQGVVLHRESLNLHTLSRTVIKDLSQVLAQNQASVNNLIPVDLPLVLADPKLLHKVFVGLLSQSLQNNPPGINFTLKAKVETAMIRCTIQDDGVGMSKLECDRLFDLYVRDPQERCSTGIGVKLFLCRQIIKAHGGEMGVISSSRNRGITFWFTLPLANPSEQM